jgi:hypothetical protein
MADGPDAGLALLDRLEGTGALAGYHLLAATRADSSGGPAAPPPPRPPTGRPWNWPPTRSSAATSAAASTR